ncbi:hypothetical protein MMC31_002116 [Peltigera leucophlebia]|nr:hypothetical protein [Peltigera leucophlebia]
MSSPATAQNIQDLPAEVIYHICEKLGEVSDNASLKQLRLVSKHMASIATKELFKTIHLVSDPEPWDKVHRIAFHPVLAQHVRVLAIEVVSPKFGPQQRPEPAAFDLNLLPNLQSIEQSIGTVTWRVRSNFGYHNAKHPTKERMIPYIPASEVNWFRQYNLYHLQRITALGFHAQFLNVHLLVTWQPMWKEILCTIDISRLESLHFSLVSLTNEVHEADEIALIFAPAIKNLPALMSFKLVHPEPRSSAASKLAKMVNIIGMLGDKHWPRIRRLEFHWPVTTAADLRAFLWPHRGTLRYLRLNGWLSNYSELVDDPVERQLLPEWIATEISPDKFVYIGECDN